MIVFLKKRFKQFNAGSDVVVTFEEGQELIKKGFASSEPTKIEEEEKPKIKTKTKTKTKK